MITVSDSFKTAVLTSPRTTRGRLQFSITNDDAQTDAVVTPSSEQADLSLADQITDNSSQVYRLATFEPDYWRLDGSFVVPPKNTETGTLVGWWGDVLSSENSYFSVNSYYDTAEYDTSEYTMSGASITISFPSPVSSLGLSIVFDSLADEYATEFNIEVLNGATSLYTNYVTNNASSTYIWSSPLNNYDTIIITPEKTNNPQRRIRIYDILFGVINSYLDSEMVNMSLCEELDLTTNYIPSNELNVTLKDMDHLFNLVNPDGIYAYLQRKQKLTASLGIELLDSSIEWVSIGVFYLNEWSSKQGALVANFVARDILDVINESTYKKSTFGSMTMYDLAEDILVDAGVTSYSIDSALSSISTIGCQGVLTHRDALQTIAIASRSVLYQDRSGVVHIKQLSDTPLDYTLGLNVSYQSPDISLEKLYNVINVQIKTFTDQPSQVIGTGTFTLTGATTVWIDYSTMPAKRTSTSITNGTINSATYYGNGASLNITPSGTVTVEITGTPVSITDTTYTLDNSQQGEQKYSITIDNLLITNSSLASDVALWVYNQYQKRLKYTSSWIQNPALESGDTILVENLFTTPREATVTKSVLNYQGYLTGTTESRGK